MYSEFFGGMLQGTTTSFELGRVRPVGTDHAAHMAALLARDGGSWRFVDARPYTFPAVPG